MSDPMIDRAAEVIGAWVDENLGASEYLDLPIAGIAEALAAAGLLAPAPLREEWGIEGPDGEQVKCASPQSASINAMTEGWRMIRRYRTDWTHFDPSRRAEGDGRTDHLPGTPCPEHRPVQHRDGKTPWCSLCGLTKEGLRPVSKLDNARRPGRADR